MADDKTSGGSSGRIFYQSEIFRDTPRAAGNYSSSIGAEQGLEQFGGAAATLRRPRPAKTHLEPARGPATIERYNRQRQVAVSCNLAPGIALGNALPEVDAYVQSLDLPPEYRAAVVLCDVEGLTYDEIAHALNVKIGTVRSRIARGRAAIAAHLGEPDAPVERRST